MPLYNPETSRVNKILDLMSYTTVFFVGLGHILCFLHFLYLPKTSIYISSLNILQFKDYFVQKLAYLGFAGFYFHFFGTIYSLILFHCLVVKTYVSFIFHKIVSDFRCILGNGKKHGTITVSLEQLSWLNYLSVHTCSKNSFFIQKSEIVKLLISNIN